MKLKILLLLLALGAVGTVVVIKVTQKGETKKSTDYFDNSKANTKVGDEKRF